MSALPPLVTGLLRPAAYPHPTRDIRLIETHISWVILTGDVVYKLKKPVDLGFLDFSTLARRRACCDEEVRLSSRFAPELYLGVVPITGSEQEPHVGPSPEPHASPEPIEWAVMLRQFDEGGRLDRLFAEGRLAPLDCERLGAEIAAVQTRLAVADATAGWGSPAAFETTVMMNLDQLVAARPAVKPQADVLRAWVRERVAEAHPAIERRKAAGRIRECHGDLHLANIVLHQGRIMAFDGIEFNESLRWIDVASDVAFLAMDLESRGRPDLAAHAVSGWMESADDHAAAGVLPLYLVYRAIVRAAVAAIRQGQAVSAGDDTAARAASDDSDRYLALAGRLTAPRAPALFVTSGISGSGKTTVAAQVVGAAHAVRLRSDVERKRLAGMAPTDRPGDASATASVYSESMTARVYDRLASLADSLLAAGASVVVDAACLLRWQRDLFTAVARRRRVPLVWLDFDVPAATLVARVERRREAGTDASDAATGVVRQQLESREPITADEVAAWPGSRRELITGDAMTTADRLQHRVAEAIATAGSLHRAESAVDVTAHAGTTRTT